MNLNLETVFLLIIQVYIGCKTLTEAVEVERRLRNCICANQPKQSC